jgi:hypothetical protein
LTDDGGVPLDGVYELTFRLYDVESGGAALCADTNSVSVVDGLFSSSMDYCYDDLYGQKVWLGVEVGNDGEMTPRQPIYPVPYALSLRPGAEIRGSNSSTPTLSAYNSNGMAIHSSGYIGVRGVGGINQGSAGVIGQGTGYGIGVWAESTSSTALYATSDSGTTIYAGGTGVIKSTADTEIAVSPLNMIANYESIGDVEFLPAGAYMEVRPVTSGLQYVYIPVTLPSRLFGTATKFKSVRVCYRCDQAASFISSTIIGTPTDEGLVGDSATDYTDRENTDWDCYPVAAATPFTINGPMYLQLTFDFDGTGSAHDIRIGNITLTLSE